MPATRPGGRGCRAPGARAYLDDLPDAELHLFGTGHFALETHLPEIAPLVGGFLDRVHGGHAKGAVREQNSRTAPSRLT
ncbi:hypothetical protein [Nocardia puris]|uniref:hypothetical protein n=1 Tax=Nocardia puris TaxID=208602 RepID=UPI00398053A3